MDEVRRVHRLISVRRNGQDGEVKLHLTVIVVSFLTLLYRRLCVLAVILTHAITTICDLLKGALVEMMATIAGGAESSLVSEGQLRVWL